MKFGQLIKYNMRDIFKMCWRNYSQTLLKSWANLWINSLKFSTVNIYCIPRWGLPKFIKTQLQTFCFYLIQSFFEKTKTRLQVVALLHFLHDFWSKMFLLIYSINWPNLIVWLLLFHEILGSMWILIVCWFWN